MNRPTKSQLAVWKAVIYERLPHPEAMRRLRLKHEAAFTSRMLTMTKYVLRKHPRIV